MKTVPCKKEWGRALGISVIMASLCAANALGEVTSGDRLPHALKSVAHATGACRRDDVVSGGSGSAPVSEAPDFSCASSVSDVQTLMGRPDAAVIDVRSSSDHQSFHIDGALNLSLSDLHSKPYWRGKTVLLIGSGKAEHELFRECARLKQSGYRQVRVLHGGMPAWLTGNQPVIGRAPLVPQLVRLSAAEFWLESQETNNLVILGKGQAALRDELQGSQVLPQMTAEAIQSLLERRRKVLKGAPIASVVLAADLAITDEQIRTLRRALMPVPLLVYADTHEAFERHRAMQNAIWSAQARGPKQPGCGL